MNLELRSVELLKTLILAGLRPLGKKNQIRVASLLAEKLAPVYRVETPRGPLSFHCSGVMSRWRAETLQIKEPETIEWIDGFGSDFVFWDVGANVRPYSLYAALRPGARVVAFEPSAFNFAVLMKNIELNALDEVISAYRIALSNATRQRVFFHVQHGGGIGAEFLRGGGRVAA